MQPVKSSGPAKQSGGFKIDKPVKTVCHHVTLITACLLWTNNLHVSIRTECNAHEWYVRVFMELVLQRGAKKKQVCALL